MSIQKIGKKTLSWLEAKPELINEYLEKGIIRCENDGCKFALNFHHRPSRASQKAVHDFEHTRLLGQFCHTFFEQNEEMDKKLFAKPRGYNPKFTIDIMKEKAKTKINKADWQHEHECIFCKQITSFLICNHCEKLSIKQ